ncbi:unnamed protein product, partial [Ceratitis capitata]
HYTLMDGWMYAPICAANCSISFTISGQQTHTKPLATFWLQCIRRVADTESAVTKKKRKWFWSTFIWRAA